MPPPATKAPKSVDSFPAEASVNAPAAAVIEPKKAKAKKKADGTPPPAEFVEHHRPVIYPTVRAEVCAGKNAITEAMARQILDWETEGEFQSRMMLQNPGTTKDMWTYGDVYMLKDEDGNKVRCLNNLDNRPFDETWSRGLAQSILRFQWAGAITIDEMVEFIYGNELSEPWVHPETGQVYNPGDTIILPAGTINGSTIVLSRTGKVESGQHSLCALILAHQMWWKNRRAYPQWDNVKNDAGELTGPVIETVLITGVSEDRRVIMTVDNCKPRSEADVFYTSELFVKLRDFPGKRKEMSRMLASCVDFFWRRTAAQGYKTHAEVMALIERHPRIMKALEHIFTENADAKRAADGSLIGGRLISNLRLSPGHATALLYLMGCSASDGDAYRNGKPAPMEKGLDWSRWDKAKEFWALIGGSQAFAPVREALGRLVETDKDSEDNPGLGGREVEKLAILAAAWKVFVEEGRHFTELDLTEGGCLCLTYTLPTRELVRRGEEMVEVYTPAQLAQDDPDFGGIDVPGRKKEQTPESAPLTKEQLEAERERIRVEKARQVAEKIRQMRASQDGRPVAAKAVTGPATATA
jgi:hypothetical protein